MDQPQNNFWSNFTLKPILVVVGICLLGLFLEVLILTSRSAQDNSSSARESNEFPAGTSLIVGILGHPSLCMLKDKAARAIAASDSKPETVAAMVQAALIAGEARLITYGTKAVLDQPAEPNAHWIKVRIVEGAYAGEIGVLLGPDDNGNPAQFHYDSR